VSLSEPLRLHRARLSTAVEPRYTGNELEETGPSTGARSVARGVERLSRQHCRLRGSHSRPQSRDPIGVPGRTCVPSTSMRRRTTTATESVLRLRSTPGNLPWDTCVLPTIAVGHRDGSKRPF
jgi:hypothetical protein